MRLRTATLLRLASASIVATLLCSARVWAADPAAPSPAPTTPARALFKEGRELVAKGDYPAACPKFEQSLALEAGLGTQFNLADCWEHIGRTASAQALFVGAAASAKAAGDSEREQVLRERAAALEPRIARLVIEVSDSDPKLVVKRGDLPLDSEAYGKAKPVDPGHYDIVAKAPGKKPWQKSVEVAPGASIVTVEVPRLEPEAAAAPPPPEPKRELKLKPEPAPPRVADTASGTHAHTGSTLAVLGLGAVGVGGVVFATVMGLKYRHANSDAKSICPEGHDCTTQQIADHDQKVEDARSARTWTYVGIGVGGFGLAAAAALLFLPKSTPSESSWVASPVIGDSGVFGANLSRKF